MQIRNSYITLPLKAYGRLSQYAITSSPTSGGQPILNIDDKSYLPVFPVCVLTVTKDIPLFQSPTMEHSKKRPPVLASSHLTKYLYVLLPFCDLPTKDKFHRKKYTKIVILHKISYSTFRGETTVTLGDKVDEIVK